jgi:hypothetical protein
MTNLRRAEHHLPTIRIFDRNHDIVARVRLHTQRPEMCQEMALILDLEIEMGEI